MNGLTKGEKSRLLLYRVAKGNPQAVFAALDEIKALAASALEATLDKVKRDVFEKLETAIIRLERNYARKLDRIEAGIDSLIAEKVAAIKPPKGDKGDKGASPTTEELLMLIEPLIPYVRSGTDGKTPGQDELLALIRPLIAEAFTNMSATAVDRSEAEKAFDDKITGLITAAVAEQITQVKRFGGGGSGDRVEAGSGVTIESRPSGKKRISVAGLYSVLEPTGSVDDSNTAFVFTQKPLEIVVNGTSYRENRGWTWTAATLTATLAAAPGLGGDVYGRK